MVGRLLIVGGGLFGSVAAALARARGVEALVFDPRLEGAASPASAGLFQEQWAGKKYRADYRRAVPVLDCLYGIREVSFQRDGGNREALSLVPPAAILEPRPIRRRVATVGDGWLVADGQRYEGWVYVAAGVWSGEFLPGLDVHGKAGAAYQFSGERPGRMLSLAPGRQGLAFVRDPGLTYFSDGTAERDYLDEHDRQTLQRASDLGLKYPVQRLWGMRPYTPGGPVFRRLGDRTWLATGGRKLGTVFGAAFADRLLEEAFKNR